MKEAFFAQVDQDVLDFLKNALFGSFERPYEAAVKRAYRDMNRTLRFGDMPVDDRAALKEDVAALLEQGIESLLADRLSGQGGFDAWHRSVCAEMCETYKGRNISFSSGQAQKWLNMSLKYLYILEPRDLDRVLSLLHAPLDNYVFDAALKDFGIPIPQSPWSRLGYDEYLSYQRELKACAGTLSLFRWEFRRWNRGNDEHA